MAAIYRTTGAAADAGQVFAISTIERRLCDHECVYRGTEPPSIAPVTQYPTYLVIEVSELDPKTSKFQKNGYYVVMGLKVKQAGFLFEQERVSTGTIMARGWGSFEPLTARATSEPDRYLITYDNKPLGTVAAVTQTELLDQASKLYRRSFPQAP